MNENIAVPLNHNTLSDIIPEVFDKVNYNETLWVLEQSTHYTAIGELVYLVRYQRSYVKSNNVFYTFGIVPKYMVDADNEYYTVQDSFN